MSQTNFTPISLYYSTTASAVPTAANLVPGELAINTNDGKLYYEDSSGVVQVLATKSTGSIGGSNTQVQFNNSGSLGGSSSFTWDGTTVTATKFAGALNGTIGVTTPSTGAFTTLTSNGATTFTAGTASTSTTTGTTVITGGLGVSGRINAANFDGIVGANTAAAGSFTNLSYTGTFTGGTGIVNLGSGQFYKDGSGNVMIGTTSPLNSGTGRGSLSVNGATDSIVAFGNAGSVSGYLYSFSTGLELTTVGSRSLNFQTNNTERMRITSTSVYTASGINVGIGTSSPSSKLTISSTTGTAEDLISLESAYSNPSGNKGILWTDGGNNLGRLAVQYTGPTASMTFGSLYNSGSNNTELMRLDGAGYLLIGKTSATANGGDLQVSSGITFPATQVAKSDANTLDDYEEGTWTPALGSGVTTYSTRNGVYTKIGRQVTVFFDIAVTTTTATGNMEIIGLPFAQASGNPIATGSFLPDGLDLPANTVSLSIVGTSGGSSTLRPFAASDNGGLSQVQYETGVAFTLYGAITYIV